MAESRGHTARPQPLPKSAGSTDAAFRSGRTVQLATRVTPEFHERIRHIARWNGLLLVEVLERALDALEARR